jgi:hypothetical protein
MKLPFQTAPVGRELARWCDQVARRGASAFPSAKATPPTCQDLGCVAPTSSLCNGTNPIHCDTDPTNPVCCDGNKYYCSGGPGGINCCCKPSGILEAGALPSVLGLIPGHELCIRDKRGTGGVIFCARAT